MTQRSRTKAWPGCLVLPWAKTVQNESRHFAGMSLKNLAIKLRSTKCFREGILLFESMWNVLLAGPTGFGNMQRVQPGTALRRL